LDDKCKFFKHVYTNLSIILSISNTKNRKPRQEQLTRGLRILCKYKKELYSHDRGNNPQLNMNEKYSNIPGNFFKDINKEILNSENDGHKDDDNNDCSSSSNNDNNKMAVYHTVNKKPVNSSANGETALSILE